MGSGMDISGTIQKLLQADGSKITAAQETQTTRNEKISAWLDIKAKMADVTDASDTLRWLDVWRKMAPTSSSEGVATATAASGAPQGTYSINVTQLARAQTIGSAVGLTTGGASPVAVTANTKLVDISGISAGNQFSIAGQTFTISADDTLATLRTKINTASSNMPEDQRVSASILDNRLVLRRDKTGENGMVLSDTIGSPLQALGVLDGTGAPANPLLSAQNAIFTVNGATVERTSNSLTDVIDGVTLNLSGVGTTELVIDNDKEGIKTAINTFITAYNTYAETIEKYGNYDTTDITNPVPGLLQGDFMIREIITGVRSKATQLMGAPYTAANSSYEYNNQTGVMNALQSVGIWTTDASNRLSLVDEDRLDTMLDQYPDKVENLFRGIQNSSGTREGGIAQSMYTTTRNYSDDLTGWIDVRIEGIDEEIKQQDDRIDRMISAMEVKENMLWKQFNAMDEAIGSMNSDLDYLKSNLGTD